MRFWDKVARGGISECWEWLGPRSAGYGHVSFKGRATGAHRVAWELTNGPIPPGALVCHRCDNPPCVNPAHLFIGTHEDNMRDMWSKGRGNPRPRKIDRAAALRMRDEGLSQREIARRFGVSQPSVCIALRRAC